MDKTNNFLESIKKQSEEERAEMRREAEEYRKAETDKAREKGKADAEHYVTRMMSEKKSEITSEYAVKHLEAEGEIFRKRDAMVNDIFSRAKDVLLRFTQSDKYEEKLISSAKEIAEMFGDNDCVIYLKEEDFKYADNIKSVFKSNAEIQTDVKILIGGLRGYCESMRIVADNTLDSKLETQKEWFIENAKLRVTGVK